MIKTVLFDLDGTLLPMDQGAFGDEYFRLLVKKMELFGYESNTLIHAIWHATSAMIKNNGVYTNETVFWNDFVSIIGEQARSHIPVFADFYANEFQQLQQICGFNPKAVEIVHWLNDCGVCVPLATTPVFPAVATVSRIRWAGLVPEDFVWFTSYENIGYSKPNPDYYRELVRRLDVSPTQCLMVGNDVDADMVADQIGMKVFLLTDCLINRYEKDISEFPQGDFDDLRQFIIDL